VRLEPLALLLTEEHPLAERSSIPLQMIGGMEIDASSGNDVAPEWVELAEQLLRRFGARPARPHHHVVGPDETAHHLREHGRPIFAHRVGLPVPGAVVRPLTEPVPLYPWSILYRHGFAHPALTAVLHASQYLAREQGWTQRPTTAWLPEPEAGQSGDRSPAQ